MLGGFVGDLEKGDVFEPVEYVITPFMASEYAHGVEENDERFHASAGPDGRQIRPPTMVHVDKMRLLEQNCPKEKRMSGQQAPDARIHFEYHARHHSVAYVGERIVVSGMITDRYLKRGRTYIDYAIEVRTSDGRLITTYTDRTLLKYRGGAQQGAQSAPQQQAQQQQAVQQQEAQR
ncbi:MAG: hypothetical protein AB7G13_10930 [Lautropia sp.]